MSIFEVELDQPLINKCREWCSEFLGGLWTNLEPDFFECVPISGGCCNGIFLCTNLKIKDSESIKCPKQVVVRKYGSPWVGRRAELISVCDSALPAVAVSLHYEGLGPKVYGVFEEGRIEEYILGSKVPEKDRENEEIMSIVMRKFVPIHKLDLPISKDPFWVLNLVQEWFEYGETNQYLHTKREDEEELVRQEVVNFPWRDHLKWIRDRVKLVNSRVVLCHNDLNYFNLILRDGFDTLEQRVFIMDYENCSYGFRGFDLAFFLLAKSVDYSRTKFMDYVFWPDREQRRRLITAYQEELVKKCENYDPELDSVSHIMLEVDFFILLKTIQQISYIPRKYSEEFKDWFLPDARAEIQLFQQLKDQLVKDYPFIEYLSSV